jgi:hypothetical protein
MSERIRVIKEVLGNGRHDRCQDVPARTENEDGVMYMRRIVGTTGAAVAGVLLAAAGPPGLAPSGQCGRIWRG